MKINLFSFTGYLILHVALNGCTISSPVTESLVKSQPEENNSENQTKKEVVSDTIDNASELDRALQRLVDDLELAVMGLSTEEEAVNGPGGTYVVQAGEYLDLIIEKTMPNSPVKENLLRRAFVRLNPHAFGGNGNPNYLFAKETLKIPSVEDLRDIIFKEDEMEDLKHQRREPNQGWIRYP